jgi:hypothetical protein
MQTAEVSCFPCLISVMGSSDSTSAVVGKHTRRFKGHSDDVGMAAARPQSSFDGWTCFVASKKRSHRNGTEACVLRKCSNRTTNGATAVGQNLVRQHFLSSPQRIATAVASGDNIMFNFCGKIATATSFVNSKKRTIVFVAVQISCPFLIFQAFYQQ